MTQQTDTIYATASRFDIPKPKAVAEADALHAAARDLRDSIANETAPKLGDVTPKTLEDTHKRLVDWHNRDARLAAADALLKHAAATVDRARFNSANQLRKPLRDAFTERADAFVKARAAVGGVDVRLGVNDPDAWRTLNTAAQALDALRDARAAFSPRGQRADVALGDNFERISLCLRVPDVDTFARRRPSGSGPEFWDAALTAGYEIAWQDNAEQVANCEQVCKARAAQKAGV